MIVMLGFSANVSIGLWTRSTVEAVAQDAARDLAASPDDSLDSQRVQEVLGRPERRAPSSPWCDSMTVSSSEFAIRV